MGIFKREQKQRGVSCIPFAFVLWCILLLGLVLNSAQDQNVSASSSKTTNDFVVAQLPPAVTEHLRPIQLIQIGANDGSTSGNDNVVRKFLQSESTNAVMVEANPQVYPLLLKTLQDAYNASHRLVPMNALVCPKGAVLKFFVVSEEKILQEFNNNVPHWVLYQISSLDKESTTKGLRLFFDKRGRPNLTPDDFIGSKVIPCTSFIEVLSQNSITPDAVDVLAVDVEGHDVKLVTEALAIQDFQPSMIFFEVKSYTNGTNELLELLEQRGYTHDCPWDNSDKPRRCPHDDLTARLKSNDRLSMVDTIIAGSSSN